MPQEPLLNLTLANPGVGFNSSNPNWSLLTTRFTYVDGKYSCVVEAYVWHIIFAYVVSIAGIACFLTRLIPQIKFLHVWMGKIYIVGMLACTFTSLLIHNEGLPLGVIYSFIWVFVGLFVGWFAIAVHQNLLAKAAVTNIQAALLNGSLALSPTTPADFLAKEVNMEKGRIIANRTFVQRFFSIKTLHGVLMTVSWINIFGRTIITPVNYEYACFTYPVFKPIDVVVTPTRSYKFASNSTLSLMQASASSRFPWAGWEEGWLAMMFFVPVLVSLLIGAIYSACMSRSRKAKPPTYPESTPVTTLTVIEKKTLL